MRIRMVIIAIATALLAPLALGNGIAAASGPEWCDDGSPPPNDWRFRATGGPSAGSSTEWLRSTTSGELDLEDGINTLEGGVAKGMKEALERAGSKEPPDSDGHRDDRTRQTSEKAERHGRSERSR